MRVVIQDGERRKDASILLDVDDLTFQRGVGVFETLRSYGGKVLHLEHHLDRLQASAEALQVPMPPQEALRQEVSLALHWLGQEGVVRISLTAGGRRVVQARPLPKAPASLTAACRPWPAHPWLSGRVKHISRAAGVAAVRSAGTDEVLWVDEGGDLLEGTYTNIFAVRQGTLHTPADDGRILAGITRMHLLEAARRLGMPVVEGPCPRRATWEELYLSSSLKLLVPLSRLDGATAPGSGPVGAAVVQELERLLRGA